MLARTWWRLPVARDGDDNPDIKNYYGRGDRVVRWEPNEDHKFSLLLRHNLRVNPGRGFAQLDWSTPLKLGQARVHVQASSGYGET